MTNREPLAEPMLDWDNATTASWADIRERLAHGTHWLATVRPDGAPHMVPIAAIVLDDTLYFTSGHGTRKQVNLTHNPRCAISTSQPGFDISVEGDVAKVDDVAKLQQVAEAYAARGWPVSVEDGVFTAPYHAHTTGPSPYDVYEVTPTTAFAVGTSDETANQATRFRF